MTVESGSTLGHYRIVSLLGSGGMGHVYLAWDERLRRNVALKVLRPGERDETRVQRFIREARIASPLTHPNIAQIYDVGEIGNVNYIAMEYIEGETLSERLKQGALSTPEIIHLATEVAEALSEAHSHDIIHRDIKPANIMIAAKARIKVLDFGLAKTGISDSETTVEAALTTAGAVMGTLQYMSPEQALARSVDHRSDLFSYGVVLYEAVTGKAPFRGNSSFEILEKIVHSPADLRSVETPRLQEIIARCLEKDPARRFQSADEILKILKRPGFGSLPIEINTAEPKQNRPKLKIAAGLTSSAILLLLVVWTFLYFRSHSPAPIPRRENLVILPIHFINENAGTQALTDGLMETATTQMIALAGQHNIDVTAASEVRSRRVERLEDAQKELGANLVVESTLQESGDALRINWTLMDVSARRPIRADSFTINKGDAFVVQDRIVEKLASLLNLPRPPDHIASAERRNSATVGAYEFYLQGRGYLQNYDKPENLDNAVAVFQQALKIDANYALAHAGLGEAYWRKYNVTKDSKWIDAARSACEHALGLDESSPEPHSCLGLVENETGHYEKAAAEFQHSIERRADDDAAYAGIATAYARLNQPAKAEEAYQKAINLRPYYWAGYSRLGAYYSSKSRYSDAEKMFSQVVALVPDSYRGYGNLGAVYFLEGKNELAVRAFEKSLAIKSNYLAATNLGTLYFYKEDFQRATKAFEQAVALDSKNYVNWGNLGFSRYRIRDNDGAKDAYLHAIQLAEEKLKVNARDARVLADLAQYYANAGEGEKSEPLLRQALGIAPDDATIMFKAAQMYETNLHRRNDALLWIKKAMEKGYSLKEIDNSPTLRELRTDSRFQTLRQNFTVTH